MLLRVLHFFFGHKWSEWESKSVNEGYSDQEFWRKRSCICGEQQEEED
jgi:hypothetical protein